MTAHRGIEDPAVVEGGQVEPEAAFVHVLGSMKNRIAILMAPPIRKPDPIALGSGLYEISREEGSASSRLINA